MLTLRPHTEFTIDDFPTLGRPTSATSPQRCSSDEPVTRHSYQSVGPDRGPPAECGTRDLPCHDGAMSTRTINGIDEMKALIGEHLGYSPYVEITQEQVNLFADATGDHQWIHIDVERAKAGPFGGPIAHGYLTLSLGPSLYAQIVQFTGFSMGVNYGTNKVRFPSPVPVGSRLRLGARLLSVDDITGGVQATVEFTFEVEGAAKPSCVAEVVFRNYV